MTVDSNYLVHIIRQPILLLVLVAITTGGLGSIGWVGLQTFRLSKRYKGVLKALSELRSKGDQTWQRVKSVEQALMRDAAFKPRWRLFVATLSQRGDEAYTTLEPRAFFHEEALIYHPMNHAFLKHVPGMLTAGGIIGTFAGLIGGVTGFSQSITVAPSQVDMPRAMGALFL